MSPSLDPISPLVREPALLGGEVLQPHTLVVRENFYRGKFGSVKAKSRRRAVPVSRSVVEALASLRARGNFTGPDELVFASREGTPLNEQIGMALSDRQAQMGHGDVRMMHYTHSDIERRRAGVEAISEKLTVTPSTAELTGCDPK